MIEFLTVFAVSYVLHATGITFGYHRLLAHRAFSCNKAVEYFWVAMGYLAFEGSPIWWATMHRAHHRHNDTALDPHSPRYGVGRAHYGWLMEKGYASHIDPKTQSRDILVDPIYRFLEQDGSWSRAHSLGFAINFAFRLLIWVYFGWVPALASLFAAFAVMQIPLMLNVVCHLPRFGYKNYANGDEDSVNVWWVGLLAMGEGWHNNHHAFPGSAQSGVRWFEFDSTWLLIRLCKRLGWVHWVNVPEALTRQQLRRRGARVRLGRFRAIRQQRMTAAA
ncbi:MAG TPA: acyl-CoA desaturase [Planktothrix sp.]|jgi:stearoyl-CoA desaturase (delta-9 desaturase)